MNNKGQALVEFIIVIPILILIILAIIDYSRIIQVRNYLENVMEEVIDNDDYKLDEDIAFNEVTTDGERSYYLRKKIELYSPFLSFVMDNPYPIEIKRVVYE